MSVSELVETSRGTWEVRITLQGSRRQDASAKKHKILTKGIRMAESAIVAKKRVMTVERRAGR